LSSEASLSVSCCLFQNYVLATLVIGLTSCVSSLISAAEFSAVQLRLQTQYVLLETCSSLYAKVTAAKNNTRKVKKQLYKRIQKLYKIHD